jgi:dienelactone hydrolase
LCLYRRLVISIIGLSCIGLLAACAGRGDPPTPASNSDAEIAGPQGSLDAALSRQLWLIPSPQPDLMMRAYLFHPPGDGPFPLALVSHGTEQNAGDRSRMRMPAYPALTDWLLAKGYAVLLPQRPGHGLTGGLYLEDQGRCANAKFVGSGLATADSIASAIDFMAAQPFIKQSNVIVIGNSAGAWGALALASRNPRNLGAVINFAGGRGGRNRGRANNNCSPERLVAAAGEFGTTARIPTLWLYAENDSYFPPDLSRQMADAFRASGGKVEYHLLPSTQGDGHNLIQSVPSAGEWLGPAQRFLDHVGGVRTN